MPFLPQPFPFIRAWDRHQETLEGAPNGWLLENEHEGGQAEVVYGHIMRRDQTYVRRKMMKMKLPGKRKRGLFKRRFLYVVKDDMGEVGATEKTSYAVAAPN